MKHPLTSTLLACFALCGLAAAQQLHVPGDHATIQQAINAASPGMTIVIHGGTHPPIVVDRSLTLVGDPAPLIVNADVPESSGIAAPPVRLAGPGGGSVVFADIEVGGTVDGFLFHTARAGILGSGFDELHLYGCTVDGPRWIYLTGVAAGAPAVETSVEYLMISDSTVRGAYSSSDDCYGGGPPGPTGVLAPNATAYVFDSTVVGGGSHSICMYGGCPPSGGAGGTGIDAYVMWEAGNTLLGGAGADYWEVGFGDPILCGHAPDGFPVDVLNQFTMLNDLNEVTPLRIGQPWSLTWNKGPSIFAIFFEETFPHFDLQIGPVFIDLVGPREQRFYGAGPITHTASIPNVPALIGRKVTAQAFEFGAFVTRPVTRVILP